MVIPRCSHRLFTWNEWTLCSTSIWSVDMEVMEGVPWARNSTLAGEKETQIEHKGTQKRMWKRHETETCPTVGILDLFFFFVCVEGEISSQRREEINCIFVTGDRTLAVLLWVECAMCQVGESKNSMGQQHVRFGCWSNLFQANYSLSSSLHGLREPNKILALPLVALRIYWWVKSHGSR